MADVAPDPGGAQAAPRTLGFFDLLLYAVAMATSIQWISPAAAAGPASLPVWILAILLFSGPLILATADLTTRFEGEGGIYRWTGATFGPFWGFLCGWLYWMSNLPFYAGLLVFMVNMVSQCFGAAGQQALAQPLVVTMVCVALCALVGVLHCFGLGSGKWLSNLGSAANIALVGILIVVAVAVSRAMGPATDLVHASYALPWNAAGAVLWGSVVFGVGGSEALAFLRNDVVGGMRTILRVLALVALLQVFYDLGGTASMLAILAPGDATRLSGLPDALVIGLDRLGLGVLGPAALWFGFLCTLGGYSAWFGVTARIPFAAGIDAFLPRSFGRRDPRSGAPVVAILTQTAVVAVAVAVSQAGGTLKEAYDFLLEMSVLSYTFPFVFLFLVVLAVRRRGAAPSADAWRMPGGATGSLLVGLVGMASTLLAIGGTFASGLDAADPLTATLRLVVSSAVLGLSGAGFYAVARWRRSRQAVEAQSTGTARSLETSSPGSIETR